MEYGHPVRRFPRIPAHVTTLVKKLGEKEIEGFTKTGSLGLGGCMFLSDESFGVGSYFEILISVGHRVVKASGRVIYEMPDESGALRIGGEFVDISRDDLKLLSTLWEG